jgi:hypothetical protein
MEKVASDFVISPMSNRLYADKVIIFTRPESVFILLAIQTCFYMKHHSPSQADSPWNFIKAGQYILMSEYK